MTNNNKRPKRALIYCRVSAKSQETEGHGLDSQEHRCREYAKAKGYEVAMVFPDTVSGGGDFIKRPGMVSLLAYMDEYPDEDHVVIFDDLKRYARDVEFHIKLRREMDARGAVRECLNFNFDNSPEGKFIETIMAAQGQLEREQNGRQVSQKMKARMESGYWIHNPPVGYRYQVVKGQGKVLFPDEPLASIVREGFEGLATGRFRTQAEVKRFFESFPEFPRNKRGGITHQRVSDILTQPLYTGHICSENYGISWLKGHHDALISLETFERVQARRRSVPVAPQRKNIGDDFALRGVVCCAECGAPLRSSWTTGRNKRYPYYLCQTRECVSYGKSIARDKLEGDVGAVIKTLEPTHQLFALARAMFRHAWDQRCAQAKEAILSGQRQIGDIESRVDALLARIVESTNASVVASYERKIDALEHEKVILTEKLVNQAEPKGSYEEKLEPALIFLANPWKLWESGHVALRRVVLKLAFADRLYYDRNRGARTATIAFPFKALGGLESDGVCFGAGEGTRTPTPCGART